jgi:hypothetical protein
VVELIALAAIGRALVGRHAFLSDCHDALIKAKREYVGRHVGRARDHLIGQGEALAERLTYGLALFERLEVESDADPTLKRRPSQRFR